jgi:hypothetical protein
MAARTPQPHPVQANRFPDAGEDPAGEVVLAEGVHRVTVRAGMSGGSQRLLALPERQREAVQTGKPGDDADEARHLSKVLDDVSRARPDRQPLGLVAGE